MGLNCIARRPKDATRPITKINRDITFDGADYSTTTQITRVTRAASRIGTLSEIW